MWKSKQHVSNGKALRYVVNQQESLRNHLRDGNLEMTNNRAEPAVRPFVIGRKNWLFCNTPRGADASAAMDSLLPWSEEILESCRILEKNEE